MNLSTALERAVASVAQPYYKHKRRLERQSRPARDYSYLYRPPRITLEERLFDIFEQAYEFASDGGEFMPMTRQLYYVVRKMLQDSGCSDELSDGYHRTILEKYEIQVGKRLCYRKAVGHMIEPHSECPTCHSPQGCDLGTQSVDSYVVPENRFNKILYVEKMGFMQQLLATNVHNRFDIAIAAGAGFSPQAAKELFAKIERTIPVTIYCLHDADIAGCEIARSLGHKLVHEEYQITVVDLGLRPAEAIALGLPTEAVDISAEPSWALRRTLSKKELNWLLGEDVRHVRQWKKRRKILYRGNRVELNAFTPRQFIEWVERKLSACPGKVIPTGEVTNQEFVAVSTTHFELAAAQLVRQSVEAALGVSVTALESAALETLLCGYRTPTTLRDRMKKDLRGGKQHWSWRRYIAEAADGLATKRIEQTTENVLTMLAENLAGVGDRGSTK